MGPDTIISKKNLKAYTFAVSGDGVRTNSLNNDNLEEEMAAVGLPEYIQQYLRIIVGGAKANKNHIPLTRLAVEKNFIAPGSAAGHFTLLPKGEFVCRTVENFGRDRLREVFRTIDLKVPVVFHPITPALASLTKRFGIDQFNRMVALSNVNGINSAAPQYLRYAGDADVFDFLSNRCFESEQLPLLIISSGDTVRNDQELTGFIRSAGFSLPSHHIITSQGRSMIDYMNAHHVTLSVMTELFRNSDQYLNIDVEEDFLRNHPQLIDQIAATAGRPLIVKVMKRRVQYYAIQHQYCVALSTGHFMQVSNLQLDVENSLKNTENGEPRFDIRYRDQDDEKSSTIIHGVVTGRNLAGLAVLLDEQLKEINGGRQPTIPFNLSPYQLRLLPANVEQNAFCHSVAAKINEGEKAHLRVMVDDRACGLRKKIQSAGRDWVSYVLVIGGEERTSGYFELKDRKFQRRIKFSGSETAEQLAKEIRAIINTETSKALDMDVFAQLDPFKAIGSYAHIPDFFS